MKDTLQQVLSELIGELGVTDVAIQIEHPADTSHGDYSTNIALILAKQLQKSPRDVATELHDKLTAKSLPGIEKITIAGPGFINFFLSKEHLLQMVNSTINSDFAATTYKDKKIMVEYAHPNTHKEMHIGHMRTLITGESLARIFEACGATVFRANYQGDIGPHVAKAMWGIKKLMAERHLTLETVSGWSHSEKAHFLGEGYARGSQEYDAVKDEIDTLNSKLYTVVEGGNSSVILSETKDLKDSSLSAQNDILQLYQLTRQWSLDYYQDFYKRFGTNFDKLFFESQMVDLGKKIVTDNIGTVFAKENDAVIFKGEAYGLHTRVFITAAGNPTYEGKEMGNGFSEWEAFHFDQKVHVVASEQAGYFQVVFKALELLDPEKFKDKQYHLSMGMVTLTDRKMSSRTGDVLTVDWLLDEVKKKVNELFSGDRVSESEKDAIAEAVTIAAVKYSVLRVGTTQNVAFSIEKSVTLDGDSGPYLQYSFVRTQSVLAKADNALDFDVTKLTEGYQFTQEEETVLRKLTRYQEVIISAAQKYNPSILATYLFELAQEFNLFYQKMPILKENGDTKALRLALTAGVGQTLKHGLFLLGIAAPEKM